jgi:hypothetical protein
MPNKEDIETEAKHFISKHLLPKAFLRREKQIVKYILILSDLVIFPGPVKSRHVGNVLTYVRTYVKCSETGR